LSEKSSYKQILKSTSLFGGVKVIQVITSIARGKIVAIFLGTTGMGISGLLLSSTAIVQAISGLGISFSAVREISSANESGDLIKVSRVINVLLRLLLFSAIFGSLLLILLSPLLSAYAFGSRDYIWEFVWLSTLVFFNTFSDGFQSILQANRRLKDIAKATVSSSVLSVLTSFAIYFYYGVQGIVPALITAAFIVFILNFYFVREKVKRSVSMSLKEISREGGEMVKLGSVIMVVGLFGTLVPFLINIYIQKNGSLTDVGLYQAGLSLTTQYVSLVFAAMTVDYFPRLSAIHLDNNKVKNLANQQSEVMLLIIVPLLLGLIIAAPVLIKVLLTNEFLPIINFVRLVSIGLFFQAASHSMGLISFAKGDKTTFFFLGILGNFSWLFFSILGYKTFGLNGIGALFILHCIISFVMVFLVTIKKYKYLMSRAFTKVFVMGLIAISLVLIMILVNPGVITNSVSILIFLLSIVHSIRELDRRVELIGLLKSYIN
jgi:O-antigen/teichoic acid export membrane protein